MTDAKPKRRWYQYSLRMLLVFVTLCAIPCSWLTVKLQRAKRQREAVVAIEECGGEVCYDWQKGEGKSNRRPPGPTWLRSLLGEDLFQSVREVHFRGDQVTDAAVESLEDLTSLQFLWLGDTHVTDAGLEHLKGLSQLVILDLISTGVTDVGLEHLKSLSQLETLSLSRTHVTDARLEHLMDLSELKVLYFNDTDVTDAGMEHLKGLRRLQYLYLSGTNVTDVGEEDLRRALPNCTINRRRAK